eukprot:tig00021582_g22619.t1
MSANYINPGELRDVVALRNVLERRPEVVYGELSDVSNAPAGIVPVAPTAPASPVAPPVIAPAPIASAASVVIDAPQIPFQLILNATNNFFKRIGEGKFGVVYQGKLSWESKEVDVAVKVLKPQSEDEARARAAQSEQEARRARELRIKALKAEALEVETLRQLGADNVNVVVCIGFCIVPHDVPVRDISKDSLCIVYEYVGPSIEDLWLRDEKHHPLPPPPPSLPAASPPTWEQRVHILTEIASGLSFLHSQKIIHRDFRSANILLRSDIGRPGAAVIADFGLSARTDGAVCGCAGMRYVPIGFRL